MSKCPNCESDDVIKQVNIRGTAVVDANSPSELPLIVSWDIERVLFEVCNDCGYRWGEV